ncbi:MAG: SO2930 family diheme c-type cytochrome [Saprospiraceae bacterium]
MRKSFFIIAIVAITVFLLEQCTTSSTAVNISPVGEPFKKLSDYNFFKGNQADLTPNEGVLLYDLNTPLFTDYAKKARFVWMPKGKSAGYQTGDLTVDFPVGAVLIKNFYYENDETNPAAGKKIIETRLLIHQKTGWEANSYIWNESQTDALYDVVGDIKKVSWTNAEGKNQTVNYIIPNKNQCKGCHSYKQKLMPIGPKIRNLNKELVYQDTIQNQLQKWSDIGYLAGFNSTDKHPKVAKWDDQTAGTLNERAIGYLDVNCGHCHNLYGPGGTTGLNLVYGAELDLNLGIHKPPVAAGRASGGFDFAIEPNNPDVSIMIHRMISTEAGVMMPELGRTSTHKEGVALIKEWIKKMEL